MTLLDSSTAPSPILAGAWYWSALTVAVVGSIGSLALSLGMGLKACPLCFYQRSFMFGTVAVLVMSRLMGVERPSLLVVPLAIAGLGVAAYHVSLEWRGRLECPGGVLGLGTAPQQSLAVFLLLSGLLLVSTVTVRQAAMSHWAAFVIALVLGAILAIGSIVANPPPPPAPSRAYEAPPEICRPPFRPVA